MEFMQDPTFWVAAGFFIFAGIVIALKLPATVTKSLDARAAAIAKELADAQALREEAQALLASYQRRQREAEKETKDIIAQAKAEAERVAAETRAALDEQLARRTKMAQDKIAQAEANAVAEVRALAADVAVGAARRLMSEGIDAPRAAAFVERAIQDLKTKIN